MKLTITALSLLIAAPAFAGDYVDARGCTHIDMGGYFNLGLEPGCDRVNRDGGPHREFIRDRENDEEK